MKILAVHPGASVSTHDVYTGLAFGLRARGHDVWEYALDSRLERSGAWLYHLWRRAKRSFDKPSQADIMYHAGEELIARSLRVQPDVVLVVSGMYLHPDIFVLLQRAGLTVALLLTESPYDDDRQARILPYVSVAWTNERLSADALGIGYLPHAYHPQTHQPGLPVNPDVPAHDVVFVGTGFQERIDLLAEVDWTGIDLALYGSWDLMGSRHRLRPFVKGGYVENALATQLYRRAKIGLNLYRTSRGYGKGAPRVTAAASLNPRAYELAACGCFSISDFRPEVPEVFGSLVPTFTTASELRMLVDQWRDDADGRAHVEAQLPGAVAEHSWLARAAHVETDLARVGIGAASSRSVSATAVAAGV